MVAATEPNLSELVKTQLRELLADPAEQAALLGGSRFTQADRDMLDMLNSQIGTMLQDRSLSAVLAGPLWLSGASVVDGTITAGKITVNSIDAITVNTGSLNVTGSITAAAAYPATGARVEINSTGLYGYNATPAQTFKLGVDGSGFIGIGGTAMSWNTAGTLVIPAAAIGSLTIANVGSGNMGGTYSTSANTTRIDLSTSGIVAYATGTETFRLNATTGAMTATGSFTIQSASSGTRVVISNAGGIEGYNGATQTFLLNAASGAGQLGPTAGGNYISWSSTGVTIGGVAMSGGKITASALSVTTLSALSADAGTITAGTITASIITTGTLSAARVSGGTLGGGYTVPSGQPITVDSSGAIGDVFVIKYSGTTKGGIYASSVSILFEYSSGGALAASADGISMTRGSSFVQVAASAIDINGPTAVKLSDAAGASAFEVKDSASQVQFSISSNGAFVYPDADATALGTYAGRTPWYIAGNLRYVPYYNA